MYMWFFIGIGLIFIGDRIAEKTAKPFREERDELLKRDRELARSGVWGPLEEERSDSQWEHINREHQKKSDEQWFETIGFMVIGVILVVVNLIRMAWSLFFWVLGAP